MTALLDADVLIALTVVDHVHHDLVEQCFEDSGEGVTTSPTTQGALIPCSAAVPVRGRPSTSCTPSRHRPATSPRRTTWRSTPASTGSA